MVDVIIWSYLNIRVCTILCIRNEDAGQQKRKSGRFGRTGGFDGSSGFDGLVYFVDTVDADSYSSD